MAVDDQLPQTGDKMFITDAGMETVLIFDHGIELPHFAAFVLLDDPAGLEALRSYYEDYFAIAAQHDVGIVMDTPTWRANPDWGRRLGYTPAMLADIDRRGVDLLEELRAARPHLQVIISGCIGPRGDGYRPDEQMTSAEARRYHEPQIAAFADTSADLVSALTFTYADEAIGVATAASRVGIPCVISFTVETDGCLASGQSLEAAVREVDAATGESVAYFMINCAHPTHFSDVLQSGDWRHRVRGVRANASEKSHAELDSGDPVALAAEYVALRSRLPNLTVVGGCCGTDRRHVAAICAAVTA